MVVGSDIALNVRCWAVNFGIVMFCLMAWYVMLPQSYAVEVEGQSLSVVMVDDKGASIGNGANNQGMVLVLQKAEEGGLSEIIMSGFGEDATVSIPMSSIVESGEYHFRVVPVLADPGRVGMIKVDIDPTSMPVLIKVPTKVIRQRSLIVKPENGAYRFQVGPEVEGYRKEGAFPVTKREAEGGVEILAYSGMNYWIKVRWLEPLTGWLDYDRIQIRGHGDPLIYHLNPMPPPALRVLFRGSSKTIKQIAGDHVFIRVHDGNQRVGEPLQRDPEDPRTWMISSAYLTMNPKEYIIVANGLSGPAEKRRVKKVILSKADFIDGKDHTIQVDLEDVYKLTLSSIVKDRPINVWLVDDHHEVVASSTMPKNSSEITIDGLVKGDYTLHASCLGYRPYQESFTVDVADKSIQLELSQNGMSILDYSEPFQLVLYKSIGGSYQQTLDLNHSDLNRYGRSVLPHSDDEIYLVMVTADGAALVRAAEMTEHLRHGKRNAFMISLNVKVDLGDLMGISPQDNPRMLEMFEVVDMREPSIPIWKLTHAIGGDDQIVPQEVRLVPGQYQIRADVLDYGQLRSLPFFVGMDQDDLDLTVDLVKPDSE